MPNIPPELDFTSERFDPAQALAAKNFYLPYPKAKIYDNLADWYSHAFNRKKNDNSNQESKTASKNNCYVLKRNYEWYYETLGLDLPDDFDIQTRLKKCAKRKRNLNGKFQIDKKIVVKEMPSEMLQPMRSSKIVIKGFDGSLKDVLVCTDSPSSKNTMMFKNSRKQEINSTFGPDLKEFNKGSNKESLESLNFKSANSSNSETPYNTESGIKECGIFSEKSDSPSSTNYCTNSLSKSNEVSRKDADLKNYTINDCHYKAVQDNNSLSLKEFKNCNEIVDLKKPVTCQSHHEIKDDSRSADLLSRGEVHISASKENSSGSPDLNSGFSNVSLELSIAGKPVDIKSDFDSRNSNLIVSTKQFTAKVSNETSNLKPNKTSSIPLKTSSTNSNDFVIPMELQNEKEKRINERKYDQTLENHTVNCKSVITEIKVDAGEDVSSANTLACKVSSKMSNSELKYNNLNKVFKEKMLASTKMLSKKKGKCSKSKSKTTNITIQRKIKTLSCSKKSIIAAKKLSCGSPDLNSGFANISVELSEADKSVDTQSNFESRSSNLNVSTKQFTAKVFNETSNLKPTKTNTIPLTTFSVNSNDLVIPRELQNEKEKRINERKYDQTLENHTVNCKSIITETKVDACEDASSANTSAYKVSSIMSNLELKYDNLNKVFKGKRSSSTKLLSKKKGKCIKSKCKTTNVTIQRKIKTLSSSKKSITAVKKLSKISEFKKNNCNLQDKNSLNSAADMGIVCNKKDYEATNCKMDLPATEVYNNQSTNDTENSTSVIFSKSVSTCKEDKVPSLEFEKCNGVKKSPHKNYTSISSVILKSQFDKENKHISVESINSLNTEDKLENKNYIPESERLLSPLKSLNKIPVLECKKSEICMKKSHTECYINKPPIVKSPNNKGNRKELALLELARRARKRLHMQ